MIEKLEQSSGDVLGYKISGTVTKADYGVMVPEVEALVEQEGSINMLLDMTDFKWEKVSAWGSDFKFGREFRKKIEKMAIVGDKTWEKWLTKVADPFYAMEAEYFPAEDSDAAWQWLREAS